MNKEKSGNTITKVIVILIITLGVLGAISFYSFQSYSEFTGAVDSLSEKSGDEGLSEKILADLSELEGHSRTYSLTNDPDDLSRYLEKAGMTQQDIDQLYVQSAGTNYRREVDTLRGLFKLKMRSFEELINVKKRGRYDKRTRDAIRLLSQTDSTILSDSLLMPKQEVITTTVTQPVSKKKSEEEKKSWLGRLFSSKDEKAKKDSVRNQVTREKVISYDSSYFEKVDTLISSVKVALAEAEQMRQLQEARLTRQEKDLLAKDFRVIDKLRTIILKINQLERFNANRNKAEALNIARSSFRSVIIFALCGGLLAMLLVYLVINDILRERDLKNKLAVAKGEAERLANVKEEFLANMSHEIRTPLNSIIGFSEQLNETELEPAQKEKLQNVRRSSDHLLILVNDILDFSKIESGKLRLESIGFKVKDVIHDSLHTLSHQARNKGIELRSYIDPALKETILKGDPARLKQILINLAGNGVKFTDTGFVKISAYKEPLSTENYRLRFEVEDTGKGIDKNKQQSIFDDFSQEDNTIARKFGGTGLGLTISRKLVELQGGKIFVQSDPGEGAIFTFVLDYEPAETDEYSSKFNPEAVEIDLSGKSLLLIDDDTMNHILLKPAFERWNLDISSVYNGEEGLRQAAEKRYDYILVDLQMPGMGGWELIEKIRTEEGLNRDAKIVLCTANAMVKKAPENLMKMLDATLLKPFKEFEIATLLAGFAGQSNHISGEGETLKNVYSLTNFKTFANQDEALLMQFLESFIESNEESLDLLEDYFKKGDYARVGDTAHKMKNTFGQLEATAVMRHLIELEKLVDANQPKKLVQEHIRKTRSLSEEIFETLRAEISALGNPD